MDHPRSNPVDHERTTRNHAGESFKDGTNAPGLAGIAVGVVALVVGLSALATGHPAVGFVAVILALVAAAISVAWLIHTHRGVRDAELQWYAIHSDNLPHLHRAAEGTQQLRDQGSCVTAARPLGRGKSTLYTMDVGRCGHFVRDASDLHTDIGVVYRPTSISVEFANYRGDLVLSYSAPQQR